MKPSRLVELSRDSLIYGIAPVLARLSGLITVPVLTRVFSTEDYGLAALIGSLMAFVSIFVGLGMDAGVPLLFYESTDESHRRRVISTYAIGQLLSAIVAGVIVLALAPVIAGRLLGREDGVALVRLAAVTLVLGSPAAVSSTLFRFLRRPRVVIALAAGQVVLHVALTLTLVVGFRAGVLGSFVAQAGTAGLLAVAHGALLWWWVSPRSVSWSTFKTMLGYGLPLLPTGLALWGINGLDRFILEHFHGLSPVAQFAAAGTLASAVSIVTGGFQMALGPFAFSIQKEPDAPSVYADILAAFAALGFGLVAAVSLFSPEILALMTTERYVPASAVVPFVAASTVVVSLGYIASIGSWIAKKTTNLAWTTALGAVANVILNVLLVPSLGFVGCGIATLASQAIHVTALFWASQRAFPVPYRWRELVGTATLAAAVVAAGRLADARVPASLTLVAKAGLLAAYPAALVLVGGVSVERLRRAIKNR